MRFNMTALPAVLLIILRFSVTVRCDLIEWSVGASPLVSVQLLPDQQQLPAPTSGSPFQYYMLSRQWPQSACQIHRDTKARGCDIHANVTDWGIHGLWPSNYSGPEPAYCAGPAFQLPLLTSILPQLLQRWPNVFAHETAAQFWKHEWQRHGTCAMSAGVVRSQLDFFQRTLALAGHESLEKVLADAGIRPGYEPVTVRHLGDSLAHKFGSRFIIVCEHDKALLKYLLMEVRVCFDQQWTTTDCYHNQADSDKYQLHGCDKDEVYYLPIQATEPVQYGNNHVQYGNNHVQYSNNHVQYSNNHVQYGINHV